MRITRVTFLFWLILTLEVWSEDQNPNNDVQLLEEMVNQNTSKMETNGECVSSPNNMMWDSAHFLTPTISTGHQCVSKCMTITSSHCTPLLKHALTRDHANNIADTYMISTHHNEYLKPKPIFVAYAYISDSVPGSTTYFKIVPVTVTGPDDTINIYALLDDGAQETLVDQEVADYVGAKGKPKKFSIRSFNGESNISQINIVNIHIKGLYCKKTFKLKRISSVPNLKTETQVVKMKDMMKYPHTRDIANKVSYVKAIPTLIIGVDNWHLLLPREMRLGLVNEPAAILTPLGWTVFGTVYKR